MFEDKIMSFNELSDKTQMLIEKLSAVEHDRWAHWQSYLHSKCKKNDDGSLTIPKELVERWSTQIETNYSELSEEEKKSDREQVMKYLHYILEFKEQ
jgi:hypothetical protein